METVKISKQMIADLFVEGCRAGDNHEYAKALLLFKQAARLGDASSMVWVGTLYANGQGTRRSAGQAMRWYKAALVQGEATAAHNIGILYRDKGRADLATKWFRRAAVMGLSDSLLDVAKLLLAAGNKVAALKALRQIDLDDVVPVTAEETVELLETIDQPSTRSSRNGTPVRRSPRRR